jgi:hypothetical protein
VDEVTRDEQHLKVEVLKKDGYWVGLPIDAPGSMSGDTLPQLFAEVEHSKYVCLWVPNAVSVSVEYLAADPAIRAELDAVYAAYMALPPHLRPQAVPWDHDNDRPMNPMHTGPYTNPEQLRHLEQLQFCGQNGGHAKTDVGSPTSRQSAHL